MVGFIAFGLVVGAVARLIRPGRQHLSIVMTLLIGLAGSVIGGVVANLFGTGDIFELDMLGAIVAIASSVVLVGIAEASASRRALREKHAHSEPGGPRTHRHRGAEGDASARLSDIKRDGWSG